MLYIIKKSMYDLHGRKYIDINNYNDVMKTRKVKIPFRYNRVMCKVIGLKTIQELVEGDLVDIDLEYCGGMYYKINSITTELNNNLSI